MQQFRLKIVWTSRFRRCLSISNNLKVI